MFSKQVIPIDFDGSGLEEFNKFQHRFHDWIHSSVQKIAGLPENRTIVSGVTDALNQLYGLYDIIGVFPGEYGYHELVLRNRITYDLSKSDCIVISHPFSADGFSSHDKLKIADSYNKPIFVDCAFFGACQNINFDFTKYKNIKSVCFSLSKTFGTGLNRVGMLYSRDRFPSMLYDEWKYPLLSSAKHHYDLLDSRSPDFIGKHYRSKQLLLCQTYDLIPSDTIMLGIDYTDQYNEFKRGASNINRVCLTKLLRNTDV